MYIVGYNIVLSQIFIYMKYRISVLVLPSLSVGVCETVVDKEIGWQPISAISLQQSFHL